MHCPPSLQAAQSASCHYEIWTLHMATIELLHQEVP